MSKGNKKNNRRTPSDASSEAKEIQRLIAQGKHKSALERAKDLYRQAGTPETRALLEDAYVARVTGLRETGLPREAAALIDLAADRFPGLRARLSGEQLILLVRSGNLDDILRSLARNPEPPLRAQLEKVVFAEVYDPRRIAESAALPADHPLRVAAAAVLRAMEAVTSRLVSEEELQLPEVSRRSPLAPWKTLAQAIAAFYRMDNARVRELLPLIPPDSAPAGLVPVLASMLGTDGGGPKLEPAALELIRRLRSPEGELRKHLAEVAHATKEHSPGRLVRSLSCLVKLSASLPATLRNKLLSRLTAYLEFNGLPADLVRTFLSEIPDADAHFFLCQALLYEAIEDPWFSVLYWDRYRIHAIAEGVFAAGTPGEAAVYLRMAQAFTHAEPAEIEEANKEIKEDGSFNLKEIYAHQPPALRKAGRLADGVDYTLLNVAECFRRACLADPRVANFREWIAWLKSENTKDGIEAVAENWAAAIPDDPEPFILLMEAAENRGALTKAMRYLERAEERDGLDPAVRRARLNLFQKMAVKHLQQGKYHLAVRDLDSADTFDPADDGPRATMRAAIRWFVAAGQADTGAMDEWARQLVTLTKDEGTAAILILLCREEWNVPSPEFGTITSTGAAFLRSLLAALAIGTESRVALRIPFSWEKRLEKALLAPECRELPAALLLGIAASSAGSSLHPCIADTAAALALNAEGCDVVRALFYRARCAFQSLNLDDGVEKLFAAVCTLARRQGDHAFLSEVREWERFILPDKIYESGISVLSLDELEAEELDALIEKQKLRPGKRLSDNSILRERPDESRKRRTQRRKRTNPIDRSEIEDYVLDLFGGDGGRQDSL